MPKFVLKMPKLVLKIPKLVLKIPKLVLKTPKLDFSAFLLEWISPEWRSKKSLQKACQQPKTFMIKCKIIEIQHRSEN